MSLTVLFYLNPLLHIEQQTSKECGEESSQDPDLDNDKGTWVTYNDDRLSSRWDPSQASTNSFGFLFTRRDSPAQSELPCTAFRTRESQEAVVEFFNAMENTKTIDRVNVSDLSAPRADNVVDDMIRLIDENYVTMRNKLSVLQQQQQQRSDDERIRTL
jgi:hypothetical protein